jgi:plastocyanin
MRQRCFMKKLLVLLALGLLLAGCAQQAPPAADNQTSGQGSGTGSELTVHIKNFAFSPARITVKKGQTVTWVNDDAVQHTVKGPSFESQTLATGDTFQHTFTEDPGDYDYSCTIHPSMKGTVTVTG